MRTRLRVRRLAQPGAAEPAPRGHGRRRGWCVAQALSMWFVLVCMVLPFGYSVVTGQICREWTGRSVPSFEIETHALLEAVQEARIVDVPVLPGGVSGMALPGATLLTDDATAEVVLHEAIHHAQLERDGVIHYTAVYVTDWFAGLYNGCGPHDAYRGISYEIQARSGAWSAVWDLDIPRTVRGDGRRFTAILAQGEVRLDDASTSVHALGTVGADDAVVDVPALEWPGAGRVIANGRVRDDSTPPR